MDGSFKLVLIIFIKYISPQYLLIVKLRLSSFIRRDKGKTDIDMFSLIKIWKILFVLNCT